VGTYSRPDQAATDPGNALSPNRFVLRADPARPQRTRQIVLPKQRTGGRSTAFGHSNASRMEPCSCRHGMVSCRRTRPPRAAGISSKTSCAGENGGVCVRSPRRRGSSGNAVISLPQRAPKGCPGQAVGNGSSGGRPRPGRSRRSEREAPGRMRQRFCAWPREVSRLSFVHWHLGRRQTGSKNPAGVVALTMPREHTRDRWFQISTWWDFPRVSQRAPTRARGAYLWWACDRGHEPSIL